MIDIVTQAEILSTHPLIESQGDWPEGAVYRYDRSGHEILRIVRGVTRGMIAATTGGPVEIALVLSEPLIVVCSRAGDALPWAASTFHWHRVRRSDRILPDPRHESAIDTWLDLILVDAKGRRVRAVRPLTPPANFTRMLHEAILEQSRFTYDPGEERRAIDDLARRCPTPNALAAYASARAIIEA